uniref:hypothetical protein n=1 Tax=Roseivirga sp. TaxID=1964215 RepID=UPI004048C19A
MYGRIDNFNSAYFGGNLLAYWAIFCFVFFKKGIQSIDEGMKEAPIFMKILIFPGTVALWPVLLAKWRKTKK